MSRHLTPSRLQMLRPTSSECTDKSTSDRHFVTWTDQEDDILRQAVSTFGFDKWSVIAAQFCNKTSRQCRRRWHTYLSADCKKGGWSPEEDKLLIEAHRKFGNRWTEIAKVVPGRTDNAVKNRFSALGKKQAKKSCILFIHDVAEEVKVASKRKVLEQNNSCVNKRSRADFCQLLPHHVNVSHPKQHPIQAKQSFQTWAADQRMAHRAHPVNTDKICKEISYPAMNRTVHEEKAMQSKRLPKVTNNADQKSTSNTGSTLQSSKSFSDSVSPPRLQALTRSAALLDSLVEMRDSRLKLWGSMDDTTWQSYDWFGMENGQKVVQNETSHAGALLLGCGNIQVAFYEGKENYVNPCQSQYGSQMPSTLSIDHESLTQHKPIHGLGTQTPTIQHERTLKVRSELEGMDSNSPSKGISCQTDDSGSLPISSLPVDQPAHAYCNELEAGIMSSSECQGLSPDDRESVESMLITNAIYNEVPSSLDFSWDSQFLDHMPSPHFSDSEKQFLLDALDSCYQSLMLESHL